MSVEHVDRKQVPTNTEQLSGEVPGYAVFPFSQEDMNVLTDNIQRNGGDVKVFVHPFYTILDKQNLSPDEQKYVSRLRSEVASGLENGEPFIFLEEMHQIALLGERLGVKPDGRKLFVIPTIDGDATPFWVNRQVDENSDGDFNQLFKQAFADISKSLRGAGTMHLTIGGTYLGFLDALTLQYEMDKREYTELWNALTGKAHGQKFLDHGIHPTGCVGETIVEFANNGFDITVSTTSSPADTLCPNR